MHYSGLSESKNFMVWREGTTWYAQPNIAQTPRARGKDPNEALTNLSTLMELEASVRGIRA